MSRGGGGGGPAVGMWCADHGWGMGKIGGVLSEGRPLTGLLLEALDKMWVEYIPRLINIIFENQLGGSFLFH